SRSTTSTSSYASESTRAANSPARLPPSTTARVPVVSPIFTTSAISSFDAEPRLGVLALRDGGEEDRDTRVAVQHRQVAPYALDALAVAYRARPSRGEQVSLDPSPAEPDLFAADQRDPHLALLGERLRPLGAGGAPLLHGVPEGRLGGRDQ